MSGFEALDGGGVRVDLGEWSWVLRLYLDDLDELLGPATDPPDDPLEALAAAMDDVAERPSDPALARLLPDAVPDDAEASAEFRQFNDAALLQRKRTDAAALRAALDAPTDMDAAGARQLLGALNDLRLMVGTRLGVTESAVLAGAEDLHAYATYQLLTYLQGDLVEVLAGRAP